MKTLVALTLLLCAFPSSSWADNADALHLQIKITRGERSKDSHSTTTVLTISEQKLNYRTISGRRMSGRAVAPRDFKLTDEDQRKLIELIKSRNLLRTESIEREQDVSGMYLYFELSVKAAVDEGTGSIHLKGSRKATALKEVKLYQDAVALIEEIYAIIHRMDRTIAYEPLIL